MNIFKLKWYRYIWELPQILLGLILAGFYKLYDDYYFKIEIYKDSYIIYSRRINGGISLGPYIILNYFSTNKNAIMHEYGHCRQSKMLGPFYLLVIGLASLTHAIIRENMSEKCDYYHFFTEKWADELGGVNRS